MTLSHPFSYLPRAFLALQSGPVTVRDYEDLVVELHRIEAVKFGSFTLKSGIQSPVYVDLRVIVSHPAILARVAEVMWDKVKDVSFDILCGVPYTALPIATAMSLVHGKPMVMRRKEVKEYGTKKAIEGSFLKGDKVLIVEDLVTSGLSVAETVEPLEAVGLVATDVVVLIDRQQGGATNMAAQGLNLHSAFTLGFILDVLVDRGLVAKELADEVKAFLANNQVVGRIPEKKAKAAEAPAPAAPKRLSYAERAPLAQNAMAKRILETMDRKQSNLSVAVDVATPEEMLRIADAVGPHVCVLKTHVDVFDSWDMSIAHELEKLAKKHGAKKFGRGQVGTGQVTLGGGGQVARSASQVSPGMRSLRPLIQRKSKSGVELGLVPWFRFLTACEIDCSRSSAGLGPLSRRAGTGTRREERAGRRRETALVPRKPPRAHRAPLSRLNFTHTYQHASRA